MEEYEIRNLSQSLHEPTWLADIRVQMGRAAGGDVPVYGLGVTPRIVEHTCGVTSVSDYMLEAVPGVSYVSWSEVSHESKDLSWIRTLIESAGSYAKTHPLLACGMATISGGILLEVLPNTAVREPIVLQTKAHQSEESAVSSDIIVIKAGAGSRSEVILSDDGFEQGTLLRTIIVCAEKDAHVTIRTARKNVQYAVMRSCSAQERATIRWEDVCVGGGGGTYAIVGDARGAEAHIDIRMGVLAYDASEYDIYAQVDHAGHRSQSSISVYGALFGSSRVIYRGGLGIHTGVEAVDATQQGVFELFSKEASVDTIPALDIHTNNVSCRHGVSIGAVGAEDLFYGALRGIPAKDMVSIRVSGAIEKATTSMTDDMKKHIDTVVRHTYNTM